MLLAIVDRDSLSISEVKIKKTQYTAKMRIISGIPCKKNELFQEWFEEDLIYISLCLQILRQTQDDRAKTEICSKSNLTLLLPEATLYTQVS